jgi:hypothetical protein
MRPLWDYPPGVRAPGEGVAPGEPGSISTADAIDAYLKAEAVFANPMGIRDAVSTAPDPANVSARTNNQPVNASDSTGLNPESRAPTLGSSGESIIAMAQEEDGEPPPAYMEGLANVRMQALLNQGFSEAEAKVVLDSRSIIESSKFAEIRTAYMNNIPTEIKINGITIVYEPTTPSDISGMPLFGEKGFIMGPRAFSSGKETAATVYHEMYRLGTSTIQGTAAADGGVANETDAAWAFSRRALNAR